ncbi:hypothetical protein EJB05_08485, partial [Eragrostis curvula]
MPGADGRVASILGLRPTVQRTAVAFQACTGGAAALRVAKDIAENNRGARVLVAPTPLWSLMYPPSPQVSPHWFLSSQYWVPSSALPYPIAVTAWFMFSPQPSAVMMPCWYKWKSLASTPTETG